MEYSFRNVVLRLQVSKSTKVVARIFVLDLIVLKMLTFRIFFTSKVGKGRGLELSQRRHLMANVKMYKSHFFTFLIFVNIRHVRTKVTDRHTDTVIDKFLAIGEILQICLKK